MKLAEEIRLAKEALSNHQVVAFPTETVMGLGVLFNDREAYDLLNRIKRRPEDKPYTMMIKDVSEIRKYAVISEVTRRVIDAFMPGSITILVPAKECVPSYVTHDTGVIGIRIPTNKEAIELLKAIDKPLLVPSANRSGEKPALNSDEVKAIFGSEIAQIVSGNALGEVPSTIVDLTKNEVKVVRPGPIKEEDILKVVKEC